MTYTRPILHALDLVTATASCTPAPRRNCGKGLLDALAGNGLYVGEINGTPTCLIPPDPNDPSSNFTEMQTWLDCVFAGGC